MPVKRDVLVTGASGFLGRRIVEVLVERRIPVRALVRKTSRVNHLRLPGVTLFYGDITDADSLSPAFKEVDSVVHAAAGNRGTDGEILRATVEGTRNILDLCSFNSIGKLVYISSCSVYGVADYAAGQVIDENASLERFPERRGVYSLAKFEAEGLVAAFMALKKVPTVCLRPGTIYGPGGENFTPMVGFSIANKVFAVIGSGGMILPLVYIDNLVQAILVAMADEKSSGQVYNVVDLQKVDKKQYMDAFIQKLYPRSQSFYVPLDLLAGIVAVQEKILGLFSIKPILTSYRLASSQNSVIYDASKISKHLGWQSLVTFEEAVKSLITHQKKRA